MKRHQAFTRIELLVVICTVGIMMGVSVLLGCQRDLTNDPAVRGTIATQVAFAGSIAGEQRSLGGGGAVLVSARQVPDGKPSR